MSYNYVVSAHKPTSVTHALVGSFTSRTELNLIIWCVRAYARAAGPRGASARDAPMSVAVRARGSRWPCARSTRVRSVDCVQRLMRRAIRCRASHARALTNWPRRARRRPTPRAQQVDTA